MAGVRMRVLTCAVLCVVAACQDDIRTEFPDGLEPLEDNRAPAVDGSETIRYDSADGDPKRLHGRGFVAAPPAVVWAASKAPERMAARCATTRHRFEVGVEPQYEYGFLMHYEVDEILTVEWDEHWRYGTIVGTPDDPELAIIRYQKTFGSDFISLIEGSLLLVPAPGGTEVQLVEHLSAVRGSLDQMRGSMSRRYQMLRAVAHGEPEPGC